MEFSRQEYWIGLPLPSPGDLPSTRIKSVSPASAGGFFTTEPPGKPQIEVSDYNLEQNEMEAVKLRLNKGMF